MSWRRPSEENALALSFLDLLSCGLGAAALLFLVFSAVNRGMIHARGRNTVTASVAGWQVSGGAAPLEVVVTLPTPIDSRLFCWTGLDRLNVQILEGAICNAPATSSSSESRQEFTLLFPDGLPRRAFGARLLNTADIPDSQLAGRARMGGEERSYRLHQVALQGGARAFSLNPRLWPTTVKP